MKKFLNIINRRLSLLTIIILIFVWEGLVQLLKVPTYLLPAPSRVVLALVEDFPLLLQHSATTIMQALLGLLLSIIGGYLIAIAIDFSKTIERIFYPLIIVSQTIPVIAIAPVLVIWLGYGVGTKVAVVFIVCFFPITMALVKGFKNIDYDLIILLKSMKATKIQILKEVKLKATLPDFFNSLKIALTYAIVGSVIAEWLGGNHGLGVYMIRVRKSFAYDKMFAVVVLISIISLILVALVDVIAKRTVPWNNKES